MEVLEEDESLSYAPYTFKSGSESLILIITLNA